MEDNLDYYVPARHVRFVGLDELTPIHPDVPAGQKRVEVSIAKQELTAFESSTVVLKTKISSGLPYHPKGRFPGILPPVAFMWNPKCHPSTWVAVN